MSCGDDLIKFLVEIARNASRDNSFSEDFAKQVEDQLYAEFSGQAIYIPKFPRRDARSHLVLREFNGRNRRELCSKHGISRAQFYRLLKGG